MISHIPRSSRIFIGLTIITLLLTYLALTLTRQQNYMYALENREMTNEPNRTLVSTKDWQTYIDPIYPITFQFPKEWRVKTSITQKYFFDIELMTPNTDSMHIYISNTYMPTADTKREPYTVGRSRGIMTADNSVSVKAGEYYYTFDGAQTPQLTDEFNTILSTVKFQ